MTVKTNEQGEYYVTIFNPPDRRKRKRYEKSPVVGTRNPILGFILDLLRGGPNPFLASPVAAAIDRKLKIEKQAKAAARSGSHSSEAVTTQVDAALDRYLRASIDEADDELDRLDRYTDEEKAFLENCRPSAIKAGLEVELDKVAYDVNAHLGPVATALARRQVALHNFVDDNGLERTVWWGRPVTRQSIYLMLCITIFEFVLNTAFFSGSQRSGIIGGAALAILLSITTIILGVGFGIAYQFSHPRAEGRGWFGRLGALFLLFGALYYLLLLTLARLAGENGDTHMFLTAAGEIQRRPFAGLLDLPALAYFFFSIAVIAGVFYKFIDTMGHYPRVRSHKLAVERAEEEFESVRMGMIEHARTCTDESIKALDATPNIIQVTVRAIKDLVMNYENVVDQFKNNVKDIRDASRLLIGVVRQHLGMEASPRELTIDYDPPLRSIDDRLAKFGVRAAALQDWEEICPATVDKTRAEMATLGQERLQEIEKRCEDVKNERFADQRGAAQAPASGLERDGLATAAAGAAT